VAAISGAEVALDDGERLGAELVVIAAGVRAQTALAQSAGIEVGRGILVDDEMRTSAPSVWAAGECAEHRGVVQGLWAPVAQQARVVGASVAGDPAAFLGATPSTTLKIAGVELFAGGRAIAEDGCDELVWTDTRRGAYRKLVLDGERLVGALLVGDTAGARTFSELLRSGADAPPAVLDGVVLGGGGAGAGAAVPDDGSLVCSCNTVTRGEIVRAVGARGLRTVAEVGTATRASTGCGSCARDVQAILDELERDRSSDRNTDGTAVKSPPATIAA